MTELLDPITPGEILQEELMAQFAVSADKLAGDVDVPPNRILAIIAGKRAITADTALRLGRYFGVEPRFWLNLQSTYDLRMAERRLGAAIRARIHPLREQPPAA